MFLVIFESLRLRSMESGSLNSLCNANADIATRGYIFKGQNLYAYMFVVELTAT